MISRERNGISGGRTFYLGNSHITIGGFLAREDVRRLRGLVEQVERYVNTAGPLDAGDVDTGCASGPFGARPIDTGDIWGDIAQGAGMVKGVVNSPLGQMAAGLAGPYGAAVVAAANGVPAAIELLRTKGGLGEHAQQVAQLASPDPKVREKANQRVRNITKAASNGDARAQAIRDGLQKVMVQHLRNELAECRSFIMVARQHLAQYGDPLAWQDPATIDTSGPIEAAPAMPAAGRTGIPLDRLRAVASRALSRSQLAPQPTFRNLRISYTARA